ncbi:hypothetical protein SLS60_002965 [Paraconiothyrium brasiliense]|uniref:Uncharacterized protein n=1 Tax=Paraconiothyrium brasiliense TaxID=300254 RepID=A0ABR3RUB5_9PLEO
MLTAGPQEITFTSECWLRDVFVSPQDFGLAARAVRFIRNHPYLDCRFKYSNSDVNKVLELAQQREYFELDDHVWTALPLTQFPFPDPENSSPFACVVRPRLLHRIQMYAGSTSTRKRKILRPLFVWGVIDRDDSFLSQLPPGPVMPGTFLHFLHQGDHSDEALAAFDPEALEIMQSLRLEMEKKDTVILSDWHAEWVRSEQQRKEWTTSSGPGTFRSQLIQPANIDLHAHEKTAKDAELDYWGTDEEVPKGTLEQRARRAKEAQAAADREKDHLQTQTAATSVPARQSSSNMVMHEARAEQAYMNGQNQQTRDVHQHQSNTTTRDQKNGDYSMYMGFEKF